jgi:uncharacterized membrane protein
MYRIWKQSLIHFSIGTTKPVKYQLEHTPQKNKFFSLEKNERRVNFFNELLLFIFVFCFSFFTFFSFPTWVSIRRKKMLCVTHLNIVGFKRDLVKFNSILFF